MNQWKGTITYFDDPVEQVSRKPEAPKSYSWGSSNLPPLVGAPQHHRRQRQHHKVRPPGKVGHLVELAGAGNEEEGELHGDGDDPADCQVVGVAFKEQHVEEQGAGLTDDRGASAHRTIAAAPPETADQVS